ncbi:MAG: hypothetical protein AAFY20_09520 [Cyanobacteria bacterium J06639_14]
MNAVQVLERIDSDRCLKNPTVREAFPEGKRLGKRFDLYTKMTAK